MTVAMLIDNPDGSRDVYESARKHIGLERPAGGILHVAGPSPNGGWRVMEVWESVDHARRFFGERLRPALEAAGAPPPPPPEFWPVHRYMT
jgi:hypothetical protein